MADDEALARLLAMPRARRSTRSRPPSPALQMAARGSHRQSSASTRESPATPAAMAPTSTRPVRAASKRAAAALDSNRGGQGPPAIVPDSPRVKQPRGVEAAAAARRHSRGRPSPPLRDRSNPLAARGPEMTALQRMPALVETWQFVELFHRPFGLERPADASAFEAVFSQPDSVVFADFACKLLRAVAVREDVSFTNWEQVLEDESASRGGLAANPWLVDHARSAESRLLLLRALCHWCLDTPQCRDHIEGCHPDDLVRVPFRRRFLVADRFAHHAYFIVCRPLSTGRLAIQPFAVLSFPARLTRLG